MRNLLAFLAFALLAFGGLGWYFGWYKVQKVSTVTGRPSYQIEIDSKKIKEDGSRFLERTEEELHDFLESQKGKAKESGTMTEKKQGLGHDLEALIQGRRNANASHEASEPK